MFLTMQSAFRAVQSMSITGGVIGANGGFVVAKIGVEYTRLQSGRRRNGIDRGEFVASATVGDRSSGTM